MSPCAKLNEDAKAKSGYDDDDDDDISGVSDYSSMFNVGNYLSFKYSFIFISAFLDNIVQCQPLQYGFIDLPKGHTEECWYLLSRHKSG